MGSVGHLIKPEHINVAFELEIVTPGEELPNLAGEPVIAVDVETRPKPEHRKTEGAGLHPWRSDLLGFSVAVPGRSWYLPLRHEAPGSEQFNLDSDGALAWLRDVVNGAELIVNHNVKFDAKVLALAGVPIGHKQLWCTWAGALVVDEREPTHALKPLCEKWLGMPNVEERLKDRYLVGQKKSYQDWSAVPADVMAPYACGDVERALKLAAYQQPRIFSEGLTEVWELERQTTQALIDCELRGFRVDVETLKLDRIKYLGEAIQLEAQLEKFWGCAVNPTSGDEIADVVANRLGLPILRRTKPTKDAPFGNPRFDDEAILEYIRQFPQHAEAFWVLRKVRRLHHLLSSFIEPYLFWREGDVIHASFNQNAARTGRMTGSDPNLQQVSGEETWEDPVTGQEWTAPGARHYFIPRSGKSLLLFDYSQIEYRLFAHYANSPRLVEAYKNDKTLDMHRWAAEVPLKGMIDRKPAKNINFGIIYGMAKDKLLKSLSTEDRPISVELGEEILATYYREVPELRGTQRSVSDALIRRGFVRTILGRKRRISPNWRTAKKGENKDKGLLPYQALNAICQGSGADALKDRFVAAWAAGICDTLITVHDELIFEADSNSIFEVARKLTPLLETFQKDGVDRLRVPIYVNAKSSSSNWADAKTLDCTETIVQDILIGGTP